VGAWEEGTESFGRSIHEGQRSVDIVVLIFIASRSCNLAVGTRLIATSQPLCCRRPSRVQLSYFVHHVLAACSFFRHRRLHHHPHRVVVAYASTP